MDLYLMQHGVALTAAEDPARPLSPTGRGAVERVAARTCQAGVRVERCLHSGKLRAEQTAEVLAGALGAALESREGLRPKDPVAPVAQWLLTRAESDLGAGSSLAIVGHLPFLDHLASLLVADDEAAQAVRFRNAGLVALVPKDDAPGFRVDWVIVPEVC